MQTFFKRPPAYLIAALVSLPIFFNLSGGFSLAPQYTGELTGSFILPISAFLSPLGLVFLLFLLPKVRFTGYVVFLWFSLVGCYLMGLAFGLMSGNLDSQLDRSVNRFLQTIFPMFAFLFAYLYMSVFSAEIRGEFVLRFIDSFVKLVALFMCLYLIQTIFTGSSSRFTLIADNIGPFFNPKIKRFFPCMLAASSCYCLSLFLVSGIERRAPKPLYLFLGVALVGALFLFWSRTAMVMLAVGMIYTLLALKGYGVKFLVFVVFLTFLAGAVIFLDDIISSLDESSSLARMLNTILVLFEVGGEANEGDDVRWSRIALAAQGTFSGVFGTGFELFDQYLFPIKDILVAENGYLDIGVRGGVFAIVIFVLMCVYSWKRVLDIPMIDSPEVIAVRAVLVSIFFGGMLWLHLSTEMYFAVFLWFFLGALSAVKKRGSSGY